MRLDFNENTVGCSPRVLAAVTQALTDENVAMYPEYSEARTEIAKFLGVADDQLTFTNGTDEAIQLLINTFFEPGDELVILSPSYAMYRFYAEVAGVRVTEVAYQIEDDLVFPLESLTKKITNTTKGVFIANPNNPTGRAISVDDVVTILSFNEASIPERISSCITLATGIWSKAENSLTEIKGGSAITGASPEATLALRSVLVFCSSIFA